VRQADVAVVERTYPAALDEHPQGTGDADSLFQTGPLATGAGAQGSISVRVVVFEGLLAAEEFKENESIRVDVRRRTEAVGKDEP
jgi:hypothetical protein